MYCPYLWKSQCILTDGNVAPCCHSSSKREWKKIDFLQGLQSDQHNLARELLKNNEWPEVCSVCQKNEDKQIKSPRQRALEMFDTKSNEVRLEYLDIKFSNVCNLSCRMCNPASSSQIENLYKNDDKDDMPSFLKFYHQKQMRESYATEEKKANYVKKCIAEGLKHLKVTGGEPFASSAFLDVIRWSNQENYSQNLGLSITTNGTKYSNLLLSKLENFDYLNITVSVDATGRIYDYIRQGSNWKRLQENLESFDKFFVNKKSKLRFHNHTIHIAAVLQFYNMFDINALINWCSSKNYRLKIDVNLKPDDSELSIKYLPWQIKEEILNELNISLKQNENNSWARDQIQTVIKYINSTKEQENLQKNIDLKNTVLIQDKKYNTNFKNYLDKRQVDFLNAI
mgnify:CR=1 FL=1